MRDIDRTQFRAYVYLVILLYFAVVGVSGAIEFLFSELGMDPMLSGSAAAAVESVRLSFMGFLMPAARGLFGIWPEASGLMLRWPLVSVGVLSLASALALFSLYDLLLKVMRK